MKDKVIASAQTLFAAYRQSLENLQGMIVLIRIADPVIER